MSAPKKRFIFIDPNRKPLSKKERDKIEKKKQNHLNEEAKKNVIINGLPKPMNGRIYGKVVLVEHRTAGGIIIPDTRDNVKSTADMVNNRDVRARDSKPLILEVIDFADDVQYVTVEQGQHLIVDNSYLEQTTQIGEHTIVIVHGRDVLGLWPIKK